MDMVIETVFEGLDTAMRRKRLYLDPDITLAALSRYLYTNRTYVSRAVCRKFRNFRQW